jgi:hypothetical protein
MAPSYNFAIIRFAPDDVRGERLNIGAIILENDRIDVRTTRRLERVKALSEALDFESLAELIDNIVDLDAQNRADGIVDYQERLSKLARIGPLSVSHAGTFVAESQSAYEARIASILKMLVEPEQAPKRLRKKKSPLFSQIKRMFQNERVLARPAEGLESHRIVPYYELDDGLVADLVLRNGAYHIIETVDASGDEHSRRKAVVDVALSALVLERARMKFGEQSTRARLVYTASAALEHIAQPSLEAAEHQGAELINWASADDRNRFVHSLASLATPIQKKHKVRLVKPIDGGLFQ